MKSGVFCINFTLKQRNLENGLREIGNGLEMNQNMTIKRRLGFHPTVLVRSRM